MEVTREQLQVEDALQRRVGASEEARERLRQFDQAVKAWWKPCPCCGSTITGSITELKAHVKECKGHGE